MTSFVNNGEGTDGTVVTLTNSDGPSDDWTFIEKGATGTLEYDADKKITGNTSLKMGSTVAADRSHTRWTITPASTNKISTRFYGYFPTGASTMFSIQGASSVRVMSIAVTSNGFLSVSDAGTGIYASSIPIEFSKWYRFEVQVDQTVPSVVINVYDGHGTTAISGLSMSFVPATAGVPIDRVSFGKYSTSTATQFWMDEFAAVTDSVAPIGPLSGAGVVHYQIIASYTDDSTDLVGWIIYTTGSVGTMTLVQTGGPTAEIVENSPGEFSVYDPGVAGDLTFRLTATSGGSTSVDITLPRGQGGTVITDKPYRWTLLGGDASDIANWK